MNKPHPNKPKKRERKVSWAGTKAPYHHGSPKLPHAVGFVAGRRKALGRGK